MIFIQIDLDILKKKKYVEPATRSKIPMDAFKLSLKNIKQSPIIPRKKKAEKIYERNIEP